MKIVLNASKTAKRIGTGKVKVVGKKLKENKTKGKPPTSQKEKAAANPQKSPERPKSPKGATTQQDDDDDQSQKPATVTDTPTKLKKAGSESTEVARATAVAKGCNDTARR